MAANHDQGLVSPSLSNTLRTPRSLKAVETVSSEGLWCCMARPSSSSVASSPSSSNISSFSHSSSSRIAHKLTRSSKNADNTIKRDSTKKNGSNHNTTKTTNSGLVVVEKGGSSSGSPFRIRLSPGRVSPLIEAPSVSVSCNTIAPVLGNNALSMPGNTISDTTCHSSPPPLPPLPNNMEKTRASPTLFEMMVNEHDIQDTIGSCSPQSHSKLEQILSPGANSPGSLFNDPSSSDAKLILSNSNGDGNKDMFSSTKRDIVSVSVYVHAHIISSYSPVLSAQLASAGNNIVQISDCEDVEAYVETLRLMYCKNMRKKLLRESVSRVLCILKVSASISFEAGVLSCLEYLEAVPWAEDEEEKVASLLSQLQLENTGGACEVLKRLSSDDFSGSKDVLVRLLHLVTKGTDDKARREMKRLVSRMLRENAAQGKHQIDLSKESLYQACHRCLDSLFHFYVQATASSDTIVQDRSVLTTQIVRQADNLNWLVDILIDRHIADDFLRIWAYQDELVLLHGKVPIALGKYEVSRLTARLCVALGQGQVLAPKETRFTLLHNWLQPLIDDFGWMQRACKGLDRKVVEEGISQTILTLPLKQQQSIMIAWFDRFLKNGDDCPNLQRAFEIWWRRTFVRPQVVDSCASPLQLRSSGDQQA